jgi:hypothetical protein
MKAYKISTRALEKIDSILFKSMLQLVERQLSATWNLEENAADVVLVDIEQAEGKLFWQTHQQNQLMIAYAKRNVNNAEWFLQKPLRVQPLIQLLNAITALQLNVAKTAEFENLAVSDINPSKVVPPSTESDNSQTSHATLEYTFDPEQYLLGLLQVALKSGQAKRFSCAGLPVLYILPERKQCFTSEININQIDSSQRMLYGAFAEHIDTIDLSPETLQEEVTQHALQAYPIETLLWLTTLYSSHGRLIRGYTKQPFVRLKQWPNFAILPHHPMHMNLAAFMLKKTADLSTVAARTQVPLPTVIDFFNACKIIALVIEEDTPEPVVDKNLPEPRRQLFKDILKRLLDKPFS